jgi:O-antigen ligase
MAYLLCLTYVALMYIRPTELGLTWSGFSIVEIVAGVALTAAAFSVIMKPRPVANLPNDWCFLGFFAVVILSNPANGLYWAGPLAFMAAVPIMCFYVLIRVGVHTAGQLRGFIVVLVLLTLFQAVAGIVQYHTGSGFGGSTAILQQEAESEDGEEPLTAVRIRGTGIFNDPNDLAMSLLIVFPFLFTAVVSPNPGLTRRLGGFVALGILAYALYLTQSRGGLVGLAGLCAAYAYRRFGRRLGLILATVVVGASLVVLAFGQSRLSRLESSEASAQGRVQAWSAGLEMVRSKPVMGVGAGQFTEYHERVAHNSFVHAFAETGFVGGFFFVGMFYWLFVGAGSSRNVAGAASSPLATDIWASGIAVVVTACFLSRQYSPVPLVPLALGATRMAIERTSDHAEPLQQASDWMYILLLSFGVLAGTYIIVRVLAVWSG